MINSWSKWLFYRLLCKKITFCDGETDQRLSLSFYVTRERFVYRAVVHPSSVRFISCSVSKLFRKHLSCIYLQVII